MMEKNLEELMKRKDYEEKESELRKWVESKLLISKNELRSDVNKNFSDIQKNLDQSKIDLKEEFIKWANNAESIIKSKFDLYKSDKSITEETIEKKLCTYSDTAIKENSELINNLKEAQDRQICDMKLQLTKQIKDLSKLSKNSELLLESRFNEYKIVLDKKIDDIKNNSLNNLPNNLPSNYQIILDEIKEIYAEVAKINEMMQAEINKFSIQLNNNTKEIIAKVETYAKVNNRKLMVYEGLSDISLDTCNDKDSEDIFSNYGKNENPMLSEFIKEDNKNNKVSRKLKFTLESDNAEEIILTNKQYSEMENSHEENVPNIFNEAKSQEEEKEFMQLIKSTIDKKNDEGNFLFNNRVNQF